MATSVTSGSVTENLRDIVCPPSITDFWILKWILTTLGTKRCQIFQFLAECLEPGIRPETVGFRIDVERKQPCAVLVNRAFELRKRFVDLPEGTSKNGHAIRVYVFGPPDRLELLENRGGFVDSARLHETPALERAQPG